MTAPPRRSRPAPQGFTLIELLVVIAIIAILTAILLPVFASVREGSRQGVAISNMKDIQQKMAQFKLDNHRYPEVLFGYVYHKGGVPTGAVLPMSQALGEVTKDHQTDLANPPVTAAVLAEHNPATYFPGLYPAYIKDPEVFTDPNNPTDPNAAVQNTSALTDAGVIAPCNSDSDNALRGDTASGCAGATAGAVVPTQRSFYIRDAYDSGPTVTGTNQVSTAYLVRYQLAREQTGTTADPSYTHQLRWQNPPAETVVTLTSYHVKNADKVLVLFESGAVKKMTGADFAAKEGAGNFWKVTP